MDLKIKIKEEKRSRGWCMTLNNYTEREYETVTGIDCVYGIVGKEKGEEGTPHLQGFFQFASVKSLKQIKTLAPRAHWEATQGSIDQNVAYCSKEGDFVECGIRPKSQKAKGDGEIKRYEDAIEACKRGCLEDIPADLLTRHYSTYKKMKAEFQVAPVPLYGELQNQWLVGPPGCGKTSRAFFENPGAYLKGLNKWWDGYLDQEVVIIDDMDPYHKALAQEFKVWAHHYPFPAETKGGSLCIRPRKIVVTSNYNIDQIWEDEITREAMHRRFKEEYILEGPRALAL